MGFSRKTVDFLAELRVNNDRTWFMENRDRAEEFLLVPARNLVVEVGELLRAKRPDIIADPRTDRSIYRLNRDTRFSHDKTPYKTHLGMWWWEGFESRMECPGFYFHLTPDGFGWSVGCYRFSAAGLAAWRAALLDPKKAATFKKALKELDQINVGYLPPDLKRAPAGLSPEHPMALWLRYKGFCTWNEAEAHPAELFGPDAAEFIFEHFQPGLKLHDWLVKNLES